MPVAQSRCVSIRDRPIEVGKAMDFGGLRLTDQARNQERQTRRDDFGPIHKEFFGFDRN
jgi:hypothetical protein